MGSCIGRCFCEVGKCFCCDCVIFGTNIRDSISRRRSHMKTPQTFTLRRQSSSATIEFENLMFEFDLPDSSTSMMAMQPTSVSSWLALKDESKQKERNDRQFHNQFTNPLSKCFNVFNSDTTSEDRRRELPIIDSLISRTALMSSKSDSPELRDKTSLGGASSLGELQWENEIMGDELNGGEANGTELEWDHYEEDTLTLHNEAEQLILEIEELTKSSLNQFR